MAQITTTELDNLIRKTIKNKGLTADVSPEQINLIKQKIKDAARLSNPAKPAQTFNEADNVIKAPEDNITPKPITQSTTVDQNQINLAKQQGELNTKEQEISNKQADISNREAELQRKQDETKYKPVIPSVLANLGAEKMFVFDSSELSIGAEALASTKFRLMANPDVKKSLDDIWATEGKKETEIYVVRFERIGDITFNPFEGTASFTEKRFENDETPSTVPSDGLSPEEALASQEPTEPMIDAIEPVSNAIMSPSVDMGLKSLDLERLVKDRIDAIMKDYFTKFPKL